MTVDMNSSSRIPFANQNANQFGLDQDYAAACSAWEASGQRLTETLRGLIGEEVDDWRKMGHADYVAQAIEEAAKHSKVTWKYVQGILDRCEQDKRPPGAGKPNGKAKDAALLGPDAEFEALKAKYVPAGWEDIIEYGATDA